jgi:hypothetical protein
MAMRNPWFADRGGEKMLYDLRMGPQVVLHKGLVYASTRPAKARPIPSLSGSTRNDALARVRSGLVGRTA